MKLSLEEAGVGVERALQLFQELDIDRSGELWPTHTLVYPIIPYYTLLQ